MKRPTSERELQTSLVLESNYGGIAVCICACGVLLFKSPMAIDHIARCDHPDWGDE